MSTPQPGQPGQPDWVKAIQDAAEEFVLGMTQFNCIVFAQVAMGWMYRGDIEQAREAIRQMPTDRLLELSTAAAALAGLADEIAAGHG